MDRARLGVVGSFSTRRRPPGTMTLLTIAVDVAALAFGVSPSKADVTFGSFGVPVGCGLTTNRNGCN